MRTCDSDCEWDGVTVGHSPREGICALATWTGEEGWGCLRVRREESVSYPRGLETLTREELAGCGSGQGVPAGMDSHPESVSEQLGQKPAHLGSIRLM